MFIVKSKTMPIVSCSNIISNFNSPSSMALGTSPLPAEVLFTACRIPLPSSGFGGWHMPNFRKPNFLLGFFRPFLSKIRQSNLFNSFFRVMPPISARRNTLLGLTNSSAMLLAKIIIAFPNKFPTNLLFGFLGMMLSFSGHCFSPTKNSPTSWHCLLLRQTPEMGEYNHYITLPYNLPKHSNCITKCLIAQAI